MAWEFNDQVYRLTGDTLAGIVTSACAVAAADGWWNGEEIGEIANSVSQLLGGQSSQEEIYDLIIAAGQVIEEQGADAALEAAAGVVEGDEELSEVALTLAAAVGWASRGINTAEGLKLQALARHLGIGQNRYFQLLGYGKQILGR